MDEKSIRACFGLKETDLRTWSPLTFAFVGDAVFEVLIRTLTAEEANRSADKLNRDKVSRVNAAAQAVLIRLMPEKRIFRPIMVPMAKAVMEGFIMLSTPSTISRMPLSMTTHQRLAMTLVSKVLWN